MNNVILLRYGELHLKGKNKGYFERVLLSNIKKIVSNFNAKVEKISGRYIVFGYDAIDEDI
ncbi:MAG: tRNA 4-thiouridine(8) synthase ThiI, partial [Clostridia bacterium]|nr:tRNA 4-thiouridine(8) synthase ThiI [Clostridia bacterium]